MSRRRMMQSQVGELPSGYTRCKYLESSGTQWIDTNVLSNQYTGCELLFEYTNLNGSQYAIGSLEAGTSRFCPIFIDGDSVKNGFLYSNTIPFKVNYYTNYKDTNIHFVKFNCDDNGRIFFDDVYCGSIIEIGSSTLNTIYLFGRNYNGFDLGAYMKTYKCILYKNGMKVCNFIPALDSSGTPCMYDTVTKQSFYNLGTDEFGYEFLDGTYVAPT